MGFYIRKSLSLGPLRFNLSKSGIGISTGVRGFRIGTGPRGNYVHIGRGGFYYRQTLPSPTEDVSDRTRVSHPIQTPAGTHGAMTEISSGSVSSMVDSSSFALLAELDRKRKWVRLAPIVIGWSIVLITFLLWASINPWLIGVIAIIHAAAIAVAFYWDLLKKSVIMMYDLDDHTEVAFKLLHDSISQLAQVGAVWHISGRADVYDSKYHAGAGSLVRRKQVKVSENDPPFVRTNVSICSVPVGNGRLYFCPDRILLYTSNGVGAVGYDDIQLNCSITRFVEEERVPRDAKIVDRTWRYVNKNGGPDRRFNNNAELPVCEYEQIALRSSSGLNEHLQISRLGTAADVRKAIQEMSSALAIAGLAESNRISTESPQRVQDGQSVASTAIPSVEDAQHAIFEILCCLMVSDGRASSAEKSRIEELMRKVGCTWQSGECAERIAKFIREVETVGFNTVVGRALSRVPIFKLMNREHVLLRCVDLAISADDKCTDAEQKLVMRIHELLGVRN
jgi:uncharacterized tellurite resistance protein B-like protein